MSVSDLELGLPPECPEPTNFYDLDDTEEGSAILDAGDAPEIDEEGGDGRERE